MIKDAEIGDDKRCITLLKKDTFLNAVLLRDKIIYIFHLTLAIQYMLTTLSFILLRYDISCSIVRSYNSLFSTSYIQIHLVLYFICQNTFPDYYTDTDSAILGSPLPVNWESARWSTTLELHSIYYYYREASDQFNQIKEEIEHRCGFRTKEFRFLDGLFVASI